MSPVRPDNALYSQVVVEAADFASATRDASEWLLEHEFDVAVVSIQFTMGDDEARPVVGLIRYTSS
jgi:hypothetical protein